MDAESVRPNYFPEAQQRLHVGWNVIIANRGSAPGAAPAHCAAAGAAPAHSTAAGAAPAISAAACGGWCAAGRLSIRSKVRLYR